MATSRDKHPETEPVKEPPPAPEARQQDATGLPGPSGFELDDFDDEFDDDFEAEVAGEYEMEDDEFARQLVSMVDFEIEGLGELDDEDEEPDNNARQEAPDTPEG